MSTLKSFLKRNSFINAASEVRWKRQAGLSPIWLDFPVKPVSRYGYTRAPIKQIYELLDRRRESYKEVLASFLPFHDSFSRISVVPTSSPDEPFWVCGSFMGLEPLSLYCFLAQRNPRSYVEVGSGNSTKFARRAIRDHSLRTRTTSVDPYPKLRIDQLCDTVLREPLESISSLEIFSGLGDGDILFMDGTHRCFTNSDVTVFFLEILPNLKPGVLVYIDDIYLPYDYPPEWSNRCYSEQYLLAALLLGGSKRYQPVLPAVFIDKDAELSASATPLWAGIEQARRGGNGFWMQISA